MRAKIALIARVKDSSRASGYRLDTVRIKKGRPVAIPNSTTFYLRYQSGAKRVMKPVGSDLEIAFVAYENHTRNFDSLQRGESITDPLGEQENGTTLSDALEQYAGQLHGKSAATQYQYRAVLEEFVKFCGENAAVQKIGRQQLLDYKASLYEQDLSETTRHNRLLRAVMFLKQFGIEKPLKKPDWPQPNQRTVEAYSQDEISTLFGVATFEEKLLLEFFLVSGARDLEVAHTVKADIRISKANGLNNGGGECAILTIREKPALGWRTKSKRDRTVRLPLEYAKRLLAARAAYGDDSLLFGNSLGKPDYHLLRVLKTVAKRAGIGGRVDLHKFRATFATRLASVGVPVQDIQKMLGHRDVQTTMRYLAATSHESETVGRQIEAAFGV